ncbi:alpha-1,3-mannosyl-glycoprotein 4-beta-N-acetylglucosaminyltransferase B-like protein [Lates japonicus]|uniref:Alpha-1,3-mannosyl-glycoprotein 4-beta-N-acetylglucosaminyltransferase B-like protein n=1 Tax=Lates japonicus TaxID=270547 RepID=A0AAD3NJD8_LATJO|nr:alpha-1,3-mannosyl-glycoprotein 4-beta-N-acetylglucosaminyltransferase B-like protein [Lates japonicus]
MITPSCLRVSSTPGVLWDGLLLKNDCRIQLFEQDLALKCNPDGGGLTHTNDVQLSSFPKEVQSGLLEVISPSQYYYPDFTSLRETFGDSKDRVKWRTKQNLDFSFLMLYAQDKGTYYVQKHCNEQKALLKQRYKPSLFQHVGLHSSLPGKLQHLKDKDFGKQTLYHGHNNPAAELSSSLKHYQQHSLERAYKGEDFFWALTPVRGDYILLSFPQPVHISGYLFRSGNIETIGAFENGVAEGEIEEALQPISALRLVVHSDADVWALLSEVLIKV